MTQLELQHNVAVQMRATRGAWMTVERSGGDLGDARPESDALADPAAGDTLADRSDNDTGLTGSMGKATRKTVSLTPQIRDRLALQLRNMYETVAAQPVPDRFAELIDKLDTNDRNQD